MSGRVGPAGALWQIGQMTAGLAASDALRALIRFLLTLVVARGLGVDAFGQVTWYLAWASAATAAFDLGFRVLLTREAARPGAKVGGLLAEALVARLGAALVVGAGVWAALPVVRGNAQAVGPIGVLVLAGLAYGCLSAVLRVSPARLTTLLGIEFGAVVLECLGALVVVMSTGRVVDVLWVVAAVEVLEMLAAWWAWRHADPADVLVRPTRHGLARSARLAGPFLLGGLVANAQARLAVLALGALAPLSAVSYLAVAQRLEGVARRVGSAAFGAAMPVLTREGTKAGGRRVHQQFGLAILLYAGAAGAVLALAAGPVVRLFFGPGFEPAIGPLRALGCGLVPFLINSRRRVALYATGRERLATVWASVALAGQALACLYLIPADGVTGAAWALALGEVAVWWPLWRAEQGTDRAREWPAPAAGLQRAPARAS